MIEPAWQYVTDAVVWRAWPDGRQESCAASDPAVQAWVEAGNTILPMVPPPEPEPVLTRLQWQFFLRASGFGDILEAALGALPKDTPEARRKWAALYSLAHDAADYPLSTTLAVKAVVDGMGLPVAMPDDDDIRAEFIAATAFKGAASVLA